MTQFRYSRWDGSQNPFGHDLPIDDVVARLSEDLLEGWGLDHSLRTLLDEGMPGRFSGLDELRDRLREVRAAAERRGRMEGPLGEARQRLEEIKDLERQALGRSADPEAPFKRISLDALPDSVAQAIAELRNYDFASPEADEKFDQLLIDIRQQILDQYFNQLSDAMTNPSAEEMAALKDMLADLNRMLEQRSRGEEPTQAEFDAFMDRHGEFFPENPANLDELLAALARRAAAFSRFMASLSPDQQAQMMELAEAMMGDLDLQFEMDRLGQSLRQMAPGLGWDQPVAMGGEDDLGLPEALNVIEDISALENLERGLSQDYPGASLEDIDVEELRVFLGPESGRDLERLRQIEKALEQAGVVARSGGRLELTPRGARKLGERALARVFDRLTADQPGSHELPVAGGVGERTGTSRQWRFGDPFRLDLRRTLQNAVIRGGVDEGRISLHPDDFEIEEHEARTAVATVLLLDMSRSMPLRGHWLGAKRMALALHTLITMTYPEDSLTIVAFSDYARVMRPEDLAQVDWEPVYGTNMEHAFSLAGRILSKHRDATKQVLLVTDGEPTAHLEGDRVFFQWPPARITLDKTYREAMRLARSGVTMNIFMLEQEPGLVAFIDKLAKIVQGRVFAVSGDDLSDMIVRDYLSR